MPVLVNLGFHELNVRSIKPIPEGQPTKACVKSEISTSSVSPELLQRFARALARVAFLRNMALLSINMKAIWRASFLKSREQADQCNNYGETEEVISKCNQVFTNYQPQSGLWALKQNRREEKKIKTKQVGRVQGILVGSHGL